MFPEMHFGALIDTYWEIGSLVVIINGYLTILCLQNSLYESRIKELETPLS